MNFSQVMQKIATMLSLIGFQFLFENANFNKIHLQEFSEKWIGLIMNHEYGLICALFPAVVQGKRWYNRARDPAIGFRYEDFGSGFTCRDIENLSVLKCGSYNFRTDRMFDSRSLTQVIIFGFFRNQNSFDKTVTISICTVKSRLLISKLM